MRFVDYKCNNCNKLNEKVIDSNKKIILKCDNCKSSDMVRIFAPMNLKFSRQDKSFSTGSTSSKCSGRSCSTCLGCR